MKGCFSLDVIQEAISFLRILLFQCSVHFCYFKGVPFDLDLNPAVNDNVNSEKLQLQHVLKQIFHR